MTEIKHEFFILITQHFFILDLIELEMAWFGNSTEWFSRKIGENIGTTTNNVNIYHYKTLTSRNYKIAGNKVQHVLPI